jgi:acetyl-CoA carboxylase carboxyltransferase component
MEIKEIISYLYDKDSVSYILEGREKGFLFGEGNVNKTKVYFIVFNREERAENLFEDFERLNAFFTYIKEHPAPLFLISDRHVSKKKEQKSYFQADSQKLLASKSGGVGRWYYNHAVLSGKIPQIALVFDKIGASSTFPIALCDISLMLKDAGMSIGRQDIVFSALHKKVNYKDLGGAELHASKSGSVDAVLNDDKTLLDKALKYLSYFPEKSGEALPKHKYTYTNTSSVKDFIPENIHFILDMDGLINAVCDDDSFVELKESYAREVITGFATFEGYVAGIVANRSKVKAGVIFPESSKKASRFVSLCDSYGIPVVFLSDSSGFMVGPDAEKGGGIKYAAGLFSVISNSTTAKLSVSVRRSYTAGLYAMGGGGIMSDRFVALEDASIAIYPDELVNKLLKDNNIKEDKNAQSMLRSAHNVRDYLDMGLIDAVIKPENLRGEIVSFISKHQDGKRASSKTVNIT